MKPESGDANMSQPPATLCNQDKIWSYFQNSGVASFDSSRPRLAFLARQISHLRLSSHPVVLNIGAGGGYLEELALEAGWQIHTLDPDVQAVARLQQRGVVAIVGHMEKLPFPDAHFDAVVASEVLEHLSDNHRVEGLKEVFRVLKPGGTFFVTVPADEDLEASLAVCPQCGLLFHRWGHQKSFSRESLRYELSTWFEVAFVRRTAFVDFRQRGVLGRIKGALRVILAWWGSPIAVPTLFCRARKCCSETQSGPG